MKSLLLLLALTASVFGQIKSPGVNGENIVNPAFRNAVLPTNTTPDRYLKSDGTGGVTWAEAAAALSNTAVNGVLDDNPSASRTALGLGTAATADIVDLPTKWVIEGDSWSAGTAEGNDRETWPYYIANLAHGRAVVTNVATAGQTAATMDASFAAQVTPHLTTTTGIPSIAFIFAGINDVSTNDATAVTALRTSLRSMWTKARAQSAKVCAFTLPHRTTGGGWTQANWKTINDNIIADSSYYDYLVRTDIAFSNSLTSEYTDGLHVTTAAHAKLANSVSNTINGGVAAPSKWPLFAIYAADSTTFAAATLRNLRFVGTEIDDNKDKSSATVGSDASTTVFTVPVDGTYVVNGKVLVGGLTSGDTVQFSAYVTPVATGVAVENRLHYLTASGANCGVAGTTGEIRLLKGDKINLGVTSSRASSNLLTNANFSLFSVRLVSIP